MRRIKKGSQFKLAAWRVLCFNYLEYCEINILFFPQKTHEKTAKSLHSFLQKKDLT